MATSLQARKSKRNRAFTEFKAMVDQDTVLERQHLRLFYL